MSYSIIGSGLVNYGSGIFYFSPKLNSYYLDQSICDFDCMKMSEPTHVHDATVEASVGGIVILRRRLQGNALGANVSNGDGRIFNVAIRLEPNLVRHLSVSSFDGFSY